MRTLNSTNILLQIYCTCTYIKYVVFQVQQTSVLCTLRKNPSSSWDESQLGVFYDREYLTSEK